MKVRPNFTLARRLAAFGALAALAASLSACNDQQNMASARAWKPIPSDTLALMASKGTDAHEPVLIRTYKKEAEFEIWKRRKSDGKYALLKTYPMCRWSGQLGPKVREGDRQVPEGFYAIAPSQMNPNSNYYLSFNVGYPNAFDRALGRTGGMIMVHGDCSSAGCFSMTDNQISEIYAIAREGFGGGQREIQLQSYPFRMTAENLAKHRLDPNMPFWRQLKEGSDHFEVTKQEPKVAVCGRRYVFDASSANGGRIDPNGACPTLTVDPQVKSLVAEKEHQDAAKVAELVSKGVRPIRVKYADGGQNPAFAHVDMVSRPEALAQAPVEIPMDNPKGKKAETKFAAAKPAKAAKPAAEAEQSLAAKSVPAQAPVALAAATPGARDMIGRWLGMNNAARTPEPPAAVPATPETILVTDPDKPAKKSR
ncbi:MAG: murein L,D-transpeptidase [Methylobacteriaceae bacterium]|nr:murein L,D-transpeptidase [Methylobacteriaceae bacterium]